MGQPCSSPNRLALLASLTAAMKIAGNFHLAKKLFYFIIGERKKVLWSRPDFQKAGFFHAGLF